MDLQHLRASDGTGEAVLAHIQSVRNPGSTVLDLDNVDNWNSKAIVLTGTPAANGFISPVGMKVMYGHLNAGDFIIDGFAPGYADNGNTTTEVAIVKMTTNWADALIDILKQTLTDAGKIKTDAIDSETMFADVVDPVKRANESIKPYVASGGVITGDSYNVNRNASMTALVAYINGQRGTIAAVAARTYTASKDTYVDILNTAGVFTLVYTEVANNAASPALAANSLRLAIVVTGASAIVNVGSINQGQEDKVLPIVSSCAYSVTDSLGNLICPRDPNSRLIGYRQMTSNLAYSSGSVQDVAPLGAVPFIAPGDRKIETKLVVPCYQSASADGSGQNVFIREGGTTIAAANWVNAGVNFTQGVPTERVLTPSAGLHTYKASVNPGGGNLTLNLQGLAGYVAVYLV